MSTRRVLKSPLLREFILSLVLSLIAGTILLFLEHRSGLFNAVNAPKQSEEPGQNRLASGSQAMIVVPQGQAVVVFASGTGGTIAAPTVSEACVGDELTLECLLILSEAESGNHLKIVGFLNPEKNVSVVDGPVENGQYRLWKVRAAEVSGWVVENYLGLPPDTSVSSPSRTLGPRSFFPSPASGMQLQQTSVLAMTTSALEESWLWHLNSATTSGNAAGTDAGCNGRSVTSVITLNQTPCSIAAFVTMRRDVLAAAQDKA